LPSRRTALAGAGGGLVLLATGRGLAAGGIGRVSRAEGSIAAVRGRAIVGLAAGDDVFVDDILRTGAESRALIVCTDGLEIAIGPGTELAVRSFVTGEPVGLRVVLGLLQGITRLIGGLVEGDRSIEIDTRTAIASVRSTEWLVESTAKGTGVLSISGEVTVRALAGGSVVLQPGEGTDVVPGGAPRAAAVWGEARRRDAIARTTV
jgi:FecR protein